LAEKRKVAEGEEEGVATACVEKVCGEWAQKVWEKGKLVKKWEEKYPD